MTADDLMNLITTAYNDDTYSTPFLSALPISGVNGTMKERLYGNRLLGKVRAKTGTMQGVSSLTGFLMTRRHEVISFAIIVNYDNDDDKLKYRSIINDICMVLRSV